jgi:hypothetical protein
MFPSLSQEPRTCESIFGGCINWRPTATSN